MRILLIALVFLAGCSGKNQNESAESTESATTETQANEEWVSLFDGASLDGWRSYKSDQPGSAWKIDDGAIVLDDSNMDGGAIVDAGNLMTVNEYENFEFSIEWKISPCGNSGIMFNVVADSTFQEPWHTGPEMQVLDNTCHPDAKIIKHRAGDLYDMISCSTETVKPAGEWNEVRILSDQGKLKFWLNGENVVSADMRAPEWDAMVAQSKFKDLPYFGKARKGHLVLQDHGNKVWYRNIKIREL
ncbi:MAG: DUF1080 domain-containing protein [Cyclobacteriaceae bacterium]|nr:DUF1080 domain-containing protein [Cyclobacteriaceae bacterium]